MDNRFDDDDDPVGLSGDNTDTDSDDESGMIPVGEGSESNRSSSFSDCNSDQQSFDSRGGDMSPTYKGNNSFRGRAFKRSFTDASLSDDEAPTSKETNSYFPPERSSLSKPFSGGIGEKIMKSSMGYTEGSGLGIRSQGRIAPVELSSQKGRLGLGFSRPGFNEAVSKWNPDNEVIELKEKVTLLSNDNPDTLTNDELQNWISRGPKNDNISEMTEFCPADVVEGVIKYKTVLDNLSSTELWSARSRSNPFEKIQNGIFINRAAMKMVNIDHAFDFMFTEPKDLSGNSMIRHDELLYFADVCAGPGGFSEYVLWKKKWHAKGFGFTLTGDCDFRVVDFYAGSPETFETYYGPKQNGDVYDPENQLGLRDLIMKSTDYKGVHFMMADGGFSVEKQENIQELLSKQLYLCQFLVSLMIVRDGGHFVCKLFDLFSPFSVGLVYLMYRAYNEISIFKPNTSRPANSERYIICKHKRSDCEDIKNYLFDLNKELNELKDKKQDILECVPTYILFNDHKFFEYIVSSNESLGMRQINSLLKIVHFCNDTSLIDDKQVDLREKCLEIWGVPKTMRKSQKCVPNEEYFKKAIGNPEFLAKSPVVLNPDNYKATLSKKNILSWDYIFLAGEMPHYYLGSGSNRISKWNPATKKWIEEKGILPELSPGTLIYGEPVEERCIENRRKKLAFHIFDAFKIGSEDISGLPYKERLKKCTLYAKALNKETATNRRFLRVMTPFNMPRLIKDLELLRERCRHKNCLELRLFFDEYSYEAKGVFFFTQLNEKWDKFWSKTNECFYYFAQGKNSIFERDASKAGVFAPFISSHLATNVWKWNSGVGLKCEPISDKILNMNIIINHLKENINKVILNRA